jgi:peptide/nickel transport system substrate-binding protein
MKVTLAAVLAVAVGLAGCTKTGTGANGRHSWTKPGVLRIAVSEEPKTLNALLSANTVEGFVSRFMFEPLLSADARGNPVPMLATSVPNQANGGISADGLTIRYHLRADAKWSDGVPVTSRDVAWTWSAILNPNNDVVARHGYDDIRSIDTPDAHSVVVHLKRPFAPFVDTFFAESDQPYDVMPAHVLSRYPDINRIPFNNAPTVGDGPFSLVAWKHGDSVLLTANHSFFEGPPALNSIEIHFVPNEDTAVNLLRTHAIDYFHEASTQVFPLLRTVPDTKILWDNVNGYEGMMFNLSHPIVSDPLVRQAIAAAIDKAALAAQLTHGQATIATEDLPDWIWAFDPLVKAVRYDPALAVKLLSRAGWVAGADGIVRKAARPMQLVLATDSQTALHRSESVLVQAALRRIGIDVEVKYYPVAVLYAPQGMGGIAHGGKFDLLLYPWVAGIDPDDSSQFTCDNMPPHGYNDSRYCSSAMDVAQALALSRYDRASRKLAYTRIERRLSIDNPLVFFWWQRLQQAISVDFHGFAPNPATESWNAWQWSI